MPHCHQSGGGFLYSHLLKNAASMILGKGMVDVNGNRDDDSQWMLYFDEDDAMKALGGVKFQEVKWATTFALARHT